MFLSKVELYEFNDDWVLDVDHQGLQKTVLTAVAQKPGALTGNEIRFIRLSQELTLKAFAEKFGVSHPAVLKWERAEDNVAKMAWTTEKDIRLFALASTRPKTDLFLKTYFYLTPEIADLKAHPLKIEFRKKTA